MQRNKSKIFLLFLCVFICLGFTFHDELLKKYFNLRYVVAADKPKILLIWRDGVGESEQIHRFKIAAKRINIHLRVVSDVKIQSYFDKYINARAFQAAMAMQPDKVLIIERSVDPIPGFKNYLVLDQGAGNYLASDYSDFTNLLPSFVDFAKLKAKDKVAMLWYPTIYRTDYKPQPPKKLFYPGGILNDNTRTTAKYRQIFSLLDQQGYLNVYGTADRWPHTPNSLRPPIPFDGVSLLSEGNKAGITLILHAKDHLENGVPTGRIFEAAASNTVIICDQNKFVQDNFGANVLYIDVNQEPGQVFAQIDKHVKWIFAHPEEAKQMAQRCHDVFMQKFALEDQLSRFVRLNKID